MYSTWKNLTTFKSCPAVVKLIIRRIFAHTSSTSNNYGDDVCHYKLKTVKFNSPALNHCELNSGESSLLWKLLFLSFKHWSFRHRSTPMGYSLSGGHGGNSLGAPQSNRSVEHNYLLSFGGTVSSEPDTPPLYYEVTKRRRRRAADRTSCSSSSTQSLSAANVLFASLLLLYWRTLI